MIRKKDHQNNGTAPEPTCDHGGDLAGRAAGSAERSHQGTEHGDDMNIFFEIY